jgi:hypothetical protein
MEFLLWPSESTTHKELCDSSLLRDRHTHMRRAQRIPPGARKCSHSGGYYLAVRIERGAGANPKRYDLDVIDLLSNQAEPLLNSAA